MKFFENFIIRISHSKIYGIIFIGWFIISILTVISCFSFDFTTRVIIITPYTVITMIILLIDIYRQTSIYEFETNSMLLVLLASDNFWNGTFSLLWLLLTLLFNDQAVILLIAIIICLILKFNSNCFSNYFRNKLR